MWVEAGMQVPVWVRDHTDRVDAHPAIEDHACGVGASPSVDKGSWL